MNASITPGFVVWITGLPASGKTTLAKAMQELLLEEQVQSVVLDSDELRALLTPDPTYADKERDWFYGVLTAFACWLSQNGFNVLIAATANRRRYRDAARQQIARFAEVFVQCSLDVCQQRDPKQIYAKSKQGSANTVPGIGKTYEQPIDPEVTVDTTRRLPKDAAQHTLSKLIHLGFIQPNLSQNNEDTQTRERVS